MLLLVCRRHYFALDCRVAALARINSMHGFAFTSPYQSATSARYRTHNNAVRNASKTSIPSLKKSIVEFPVERIRNIGIMAHIDAGKTTTTERMLYLTGEIASAGDVDDGTTSTDYLEQERERGISITAAAVTMHWNSVFDSVSEPDAAKTVESAANAQSVKTKTSRINLIDTPGHVDFTIEVERSLRVVDAAIALLDASAGVEAQTVTVWRQADRYALPRIAFLNKMDKANADFHFSVDSLRRRLNAIPLVMQLPIGFGSTFRGVIDVLTGDAYVFNAGREINRKQPEVTEQNHGFYTVSFSKDVDHFKETCDGSKTCQELLSARRRVLEMCAELDNKFADEFLSGDFDEKSFRPEQIAAMKRAVRRITLGDNSDISNASQNSSSSGKWDADEPFQERVIPVFCGSAKRCIAVHQLLNAVVDYLPSPIDRRHSFMNYYQPDDCVALVFKVIGEAQLKALGDASANQRGSLALLRIYSGSLRAGQSVFNINRSENEKVARIFAVAADSFSDVDRVDRGNVIAVSGISNAVTGDTLVGSQTVAIRALRNYVEKQRRAAVGESLIDPDSIKAASVDLSSETNSPILAALSVPDPVFVCTCEPPTIAQLRTLQHALTCLTREDPSLRVSSDPETQQILLHGMGELHLEIIRDRIKREYGVEVRFGPLQISYREQPTAFAECTSTVEADVGGRRAVSVTLSIVPNETVDDVPRRLRLVSASKSNLSTPSPSSLPNVISNWSSLHPLVIDAMNRGISTLRTGPLLRFPVVRCDVNAHAIAFDRPSTAGAHSLVTAAVADCLRKCLAQASMRILEPCAELEVTTTRRKLGLIMQDFSRRRATIHHHSVKSSGATQDNSKSSQFDPELAIVSVFARCPLSQLHRYSTELRVLASGEATFAMRLSGYQPLDAKQQQELLDKFYLRESS